MHPIDGNPPPGEAPAVPTVWNGEGATLAPVHPINGDALLGVTPAVPTDVVRWECGARAYVPGQAPTVARLSAMPTEDRDKNGRWVASHVCAHAWRAAMPDATQLRTRGHLVCSRCPDAREVIRRTHERALAVGGVANCQGATRGAFVLIRRCQTLVVRPALACPNGRTLVPLRGDIGCSRACV